LNGENQKGTRSEWFGEKKREKIPISFMPVVKIWGPLLKLVLIHMGPGVKGKNK
jgi:hypothetical protein